MSKTKPSQLPPEPAETDLPEAWALVALQDVCEVNPGKPPADALPASTPVTFVPMPAVDADSGTINRAAQKPFAEARRGSYTPFQEDDILIAKITPCMENGKAAIARNLLNGLGFGSTEFHVLRPRGAVLPDYVYRYVRQESFREEAKRHMSGNVGQQRVPADFIKNAELPLPPLAEQTRIVAKVEELLGRASAARARLARLPAILKRFRQSVLAAACSGQLTEDWRAYDVPEGEAEAGLPAGWQRQALRGLCSGFEYGSSRKSDDAGDVPVLRMGNVQDGRIDWANLKYSSDAEEIAKYSLSPNTVLFNRTNSPELVGKTAIYRGERPAIFAGYLIRMVHGPELDAEYLNYCLNEQAFREYCMQVKSDGVSQSNINAKKLAAYEIALPPITEQREIIRRVDALFVLAERIEGHVRPATLRAKKLTQAILARAFRGELVPTEAELARAEGRDYETVSALLERVRPPTLIPSATHRRSRAARKRR